MFFHLTIKKCIAFFVVFAKGKFFPDGEFWMFNENNLEQIVGKEAFSALRSGKAVLIIWRRSSPHNWYIEEIHSKKTLWHSGEEYPRMLPNLSLFELVFYSHKKIPNYPFGTDCGKSEQSVYKLK